LTDFQKFDAWKTQNATALKASLQTKLGMALGPFLIQKGGTNSIVVPMDEKKITDAYGQEQSVPKTPQEKGQELDVYVQRIKAVIHEIWGDKQKYTQDEFKLVIHEIAIAKMFEAQFCRQQRDPKDNKENLILFKNNFASRMHF
jgi:hypothetical protein